MIRIFSTLKTETSCIIYTDAANLPDGVFEPDVAEDNVAE